MSRTPSFQTDEFQPGQRVEHTINQHRLVIGYRDDDPRRWFLRDDIRGGVVLGNCVDCKHEVYGDHGAQRTVRERDTRVGCMWCHEQFVQIERHHQSGMITEL